MSWMAEAKSAVVRVGDGRGFVVETIGQERHVVRAAQGRYVVTAAHRLPRLPSAQSASYLEERTYAKLLGPLEGECGVWAECTFADPVEDVAVLHEPDNQELPDEVEEFRALVEAPTRAFSVRAPQADVLCGWLLSLDGEWFAVQVNAPAGWRFFLNPDPVAGGISGSPIVDDDGFAVGVVNLGGECGASSPKLCDVLPGRMLRWLGVK
jgi:hypothetical protein